MLHDTHRDVVQILSCSPCTDSVIDFPSSTMALSRLLDLLLGPEPVPDTPFIKAATLGLGLLQSSIYIRVPCRAASENLKSSCTTIRKSFRKTFAFSHSSCSFPFFHSLLRTRTGLQGLKDDWLAENSESREEEVTRKQLEVHRHRRSPSPRSPAMCVNLS